jgi:beta-galactosidase/beta-glucuronidase
LSKDRGPDLLPITIQSHTVEVEVSVASHRTPNQPMATKTLNVILPPGATEMATELKIPDPVLWSLDDPHLYVATVRLHEAKGIGPTRTKSSPGRAGQLASSPLLLDSESVRFGMREFTIKDNDFYLNGERVFIKGAFWEGLYPSTLGHPRNPEIVRKEIRMAKEAGLNLLRPWRMPPAPMILEIADEMGMLIVGSPAIACMGYWLAETPNMEERWTRAFTEMIRRDRNHPSIVMWETTNEIVRKSMLVRRHRVSLAGRALDPTRVIIDESGGARSVWGSFAYLPYSREPTQFADRHLYYRAM